MNLKRNLKLFDIHSSSLTPLSGQNLLHTDISYHLINSLCRNQLVGLNDLLTHKAPRTKKSSVCVHPLSYHVVDLKSIRSDTLIKKFCTFILASFLNKNNQQAYTLEILTLCLITSFSACLFKGCPPDKPSLL